MAKNVVWITRWLNELKFNFVCNLFIRLLNDNQKSLDLIKNFENHSRIKHIDVQYHYIRKIAENELIKTSYVSINEMIADVFTKPTTPVIFKKLKKKLNLYWIFQKIEKDEKKWNDKTWNFAKRFEANTQTPNNRIGDEPIDTHTRKISYVLIEYGMGANLVMKMLKLRNQLYALYLTISLAL